VAIGGTSGGMHLQVCVLESKLMTAQQKFIYVCFLLINFSCEDKLAWIKMPEAVVPVVISMTPSSGPIGTTVEISGNNFSTNLSGNVVTINGTAASVTEASSTRIVFVAPAETSGPVVVTVNNKQASNAPVFTYQ
jgi:IPT/TIG domain